MSKGMWLRKPRRPLGERVRPPTWFHKKRPPPPPPPVRCWSVKNRSDLAPPAASFPQLKAERACRSSASCASHSPNRLLAMDRARSWLASRGLDMWFWPPDPASLFWRGRASYAQALLLNRRLPGSQASIQVGEGGFWLSFAADVRALFQARRRPPPLPRRRKEAPPRPPAISWPSRATARR